VRPRDNVASAWVFKFEKENQQWRKLNSNRDVATCNNSLQALKIRYGSLYHEQRFTGAAKRGNGNKKALTLNGGSPKAITEFVR
jgi:hypothetical protein